MGTEDVSKAVEDCASSDNSDCTSDIMAAGQQLGLTAVAVTNSIKDCKTSDPKPKFEASTCSADIESAGEDLADATTKVLSAIKVCQGSDKVKCTEAISEVV